METVASDFIAVHSSGGEKEDSDGVENGGVEVDSRRISSGDKEKEEAGVSAELAGCESDAQQRIHLGGPPEAVAGEGFDSDMEIEDLNEVPASEGSGDAVVSNGVCDLSRVDDESSKKKGVKRPRMMFEEDSPSVCVKYNFLTRSSKLKLEELLRQWSEWDARHSSSAQDSVEPLESGEDTYFPALHIGLEKTTSVSFWIDHKTRKHKDEEFVPLDHKSVPLYDRGYALGLTSDDGISNVEKGLEVVNDAARCFNCGSYGHALKDCPKPRDNTAVNTARKQHKLKRNQNSSSRYYQNSPSGKYDGLRPGALDPETRKLLGLGELDPPPWLSRMREIGYPPGYLDPDEEDQPSGITIFADDESKEDQEDGEIVETDRSEPAKRMSVEFPGINGPVPKNADRRLWASASPPILDVSRGRLLHRFTASEPILIRNRVHHHLHEERRSRLEPRDDDRPPGVGFDPLVSTYLPRYGSGYEYDHHSPSSRLEPFGRSEPDIGPRSRFRDESFSYSPHSDHLSPLDHGYSRHGNRVDRNYDFNHSPHGHSREWQDRNRHHSRR